MMRRLLKLAAALCIFVALPAQAHGDIRFSVTDLGALDPAQPSTVGTAINNAGVVVGNSSIAGKPHPFYWDGTLHEIHGLGETSGVASAIDDGGTIVGWTMPGPLLFALKDGAVTQIAPPRATFAFGPVFINDADVIVAQPFGDDKCDLSNTPFTVDLRAGPTRTPLRHLACANVAGIDNRERVLADAFVAGHFVWTFSAASSGPVRRLGSASSYLNIAAMHPRTGHMAADVQIGENEYPVIYDPSTNVIRVIPRVSPAFPTAIATAINGLDQVVGTACGSIGLCDSGNDAFEYDPTMGSIDLNKVAAIPSGFFSYVAVAINDAGQIVVNALGGSFGQSRAFLLTPMSRRP